ncbi:hypothetical protein IE077_002938, partial [Cardiosporidium cionae]
LPTISQVKQQSKLEDNEEDQVCCFFARTPEQREFVLLFYPKDETLEIREILRSQQHEMCFRKFLRRQKIIKGENLVKWPGHDMVEPYLSILDFQVPAEMKILNQYYFIYDTNDDTRQFFKNNLDISLHPKELHAETDIQIIEKAKPGDCINTFDIEVTQNNENTMALPLEMHSLSHKNEEEKMLCFEALLLNPEFDNTRSLFIIIFYLSDDTLSVIERRNIDISFEEATYLPRGKYINAATEKNFNSSNFFLGNILRVCGQDFSLSKEITRKDESEVEILDKNGNDNTVNEAITKLYSAIANIEEEQFSNDVQIPYH